MNFGEKIKSLIKEAELYKSQGLLNEALDRYKQVEALLESTQDIKNKEELVGKITRKIDALYGRIDSELSVPEPPEVSEEAKSVIKELFSPDDPEAKGSPAMAGALSLAGFGQYDQAMKELERLLSDESLRVDAAKNIVWCRTEQGRGGKVLEILKQWRDEDTLSFGEINQVREYFEGLVKNSPLEGRISPEKIRKELEPESEVDEEEILDVTAARFKLPRGGRQGEEVELEVSFQAGCYLKMLVSKGDRHIIEGIGVGDRIKDVTFYSPAAIFYGTGYISSKVAIAGGPKKGNFSLEIKILNIES